MKNRRMILRRCITVTSHLRILGNWKHQVTEGKRQISRVRNPFTWSKSTSIVLDDRELQIVLVENLRI